MKRMSSNSILLILFGFALVLQAGQLQAQEPTITYIYDDLGRLLRVINEHNECATYAYDAVGNILSITRSTNCLEAPTIESIVPDSAQAGDTVCIIITGTNFLGATVTTDNPEIQMSQVRVSETRIDLCLAISFLSPIGPTRLIVTTPGGVAEGIFTIGAANPTITGIDPPSGPPTRLVTISGTAFSPTPSANIVNFNGATATVFSSTVFSITAAVPSDVTPGPVMVTVTVDGRVSNAFPFTVTTPTGPPPVITSVTPNQGSVEGGTSVLISGSGFTATTSVFLDSKAATVSFIDATAIRIITPAGTEGPADVLVSNANGSALLLNGFTYIAGPVLQVVAVNPTLGLSDIPTNVPVGVLFSSPINPTTVGTSSFSLTPCGTSTQISGSFTFDFGDTAAIFRPSGNLAPNTCFTLSLTQGIQSALGLPLDTPLSGSFTTAGSPDTISPNVNVNPPNGATGVPRNTSIVFAFSEPMNRVTVNPLTLQVSNNGQPVTGSITLAQGNRVVTFRPATLFLANSIVEIVLSAKVWSGIRTVVSLSRLRASSQQGRCPLVPSTQGRSFPWATAPSRWRWPM
ncbi:MAG: IPT/TIG domain-containing protein [candidate division NC10 bacterium]|nr:IPT/TIG domain-containing protein [candidate division NC10 bacterium]